MHPAIRFENIQKTFFTKNGYVVALDGVTFNVQQDTFTTVVGPSGCGKSTLLKMCAGVMAPSGGRVVYRDRVVNTTNTDVGLITQDSNLFPWLTLEGNVELPLKLKGIGKPERRERVAEYLALAGLTGFERHYPHQLSGGMQKRGAIIRTMVYDPDIILMDEPFGSLDAQTRTVLHQELLRIWSTRRKTILFITHDLMEAVTLSDRVVVLSARPSTVKAEIDVPLERPRDVIDIHTQAGFSETYTRLWDFFRSELQVG
jgi:NitT/TauT family transport system ATP-binding protein